MQISDKLAYEIFIITIFHITALLLLFSFCVYIYLNAKKTPLLYSYLSVAGMIGLWLISKILKTISPTEGLRWFFIVLQYFGINFLGFFLLVFAYIYTRGRLPAKRQLFIWSIPSFIAFGILASNPLHMGFYSYYDFYKDKFGPLFLPTQTVQYIFWLIGIIMLSNNFTKQPAFLKKRNFGRFFAAMTLLPLLTNLYYLFYKMNVFPWVFPFPVFDITPIAGTIALILFMIPAYKYRFFDISPASYERIYELMPCGMVFVGEKGLFYGGNSSFYRMFRLPPKDISTDDFLDKLKDEHAREAFSAFFREPQMKECELSLKNGQSYRISKNAKMNGSVLLYVTDITEIDRNRALLSQQNAELQDIQNKLGNMANTMKELTAARTKSQIAQNVHDILGHSLTVVIGMTELAATEENVLLAKERLTYADELLSSSLHDLKNAMESDTAKWEKTSLLGAIEHLKNENIGVDIAVHGEVYELNTAKTEALFRLCQEGVTNAMKHGGAKTIYIILRYKKDETEIFAIDNGVGCKNIVKSHGLTGIEKRIEDLGGQVEFTSDGESGFTIRATVPR